MGSQWWVSGESVSETCMAFFFCMITRRGVRRGLDAGRKRVREGLEASRKRVREGLDAGRKRVREGLEEG